MEEFIKQLGVDWRLLISQAINFLIVFVVLRAFVYKPMANILHERQKKVKEGIAKTEEADRRLRDIQDMAREKFQEAEHRATALLQEMEVVAKEREAILLESSRRKGEILFQEAARSIEAERIKARSELDREAKNLVRSTLEHVVEMRPELFDEVLLEQALRGVRTKRI